MALEMRESCERCGAPVTFNAEAFICSYECTFCPSCTAASTASARTAAASSFGVRDAVNREIPADGCRDRTRVRALINGETVEPRPASPRPVEPATGETFAAAAMAGEADVDRAVEAARAALDGDWGKTPRERALAPPARARRRDRREPQGAHRARGAERRQGDLRGQGRALRRGRELPLLRLGDRARSPAARTRSAARSSPTR